MTTVTYNDARMHDEIARAMGYAVTKDIDPDTYALFVDVFEAGFMHGFAKASEAGVRV